MGRSTGSTGVAESYSLENIWDRQHVQEGEISLSVVRM
jgi:hypothetical protein